MTPAPTWSGSAPASPTAAPCNAAKPKRSPGNHPRSRGAICALRDTKEVQMRKPLVAALAGASALGGVMIAQTTAAQPYYAPAPARVYEPGYRYDEFGRPYYDDGYRPGYYAEGAAVVGPALVEGYARVPV